MIKLDSVASCRLIQRRSRFALSLLSLARLFTAGLCLLRRLAATGGLVRDLARILLLFCVLALALYEALLGMLER